MLPCLYLCSQPGVDHACTSSVASRALVLLRTCVEEGEEVVAHLVYISLSLPLNAFWLILSLSNYCHTSFRKNTTLLVRKKRRVAGSRGEGV